MDGVLSISICRMTDVICRILGDRAPSVYLHGSAAVGDYREGWSDIDLLVLTEQTIDPAQAQRLVGLRQTLGDPVFRAFEGGMLSLEAFLQNTPDRVVYWGTSGERITDRYDFNSLSRLDLLENGVLLHGREVRDRMHRPTAAELRADIAAHLDTVRRYAHLTGKSLYTFGWLLDISRCLYTLRTGGILPKTKAGEWALSEGLCPVPEALALALRARKEPLVYGRAQVVLDRAGALNRDIQRYGDVLEAALHAAGNGN